MKREVKTLVIQALLHGENSEVMTSRLALILSDAHIDVLVTGVPYAVKSYNEKNLMALVVKRNNNIIPCSTITSVKLVGELRTEVLVEGYFVAEFFAESEEKAVTLATKDSISNWCGWRREKNNSYPYSFKGRYGFDVRISLDDVLNAGAIDVEFV